MSKTEKQFALIGAGPMGLAAAKTLGEQGIPYQGFELHSDVGGLWDINAPRSTMYESAHLISSKSMTEFADFPMAEDVAEYPSHRALRGYFQDFAKHFDLYDRYHFNAEVTACRPETDGGWRVHWHQDGKDHEAVFKGIIIANGTLSEPNMPTFPGDFDGELIHASAYRYPEQFKDKRVLIVGAGNSGCDIAVDAIHHGKSCDLSMRRGYYFVPKYVFGKPADTMGGMIKLPMWLKRRIDGLILKWFVGDPQKYGFPKPDYALYESHPVVNSLILFHAGHGDLKIQPDFAELKGKTVIFKDGTSAEYDMILAATGYRLHYPFVEPELLNWQGDAPHLFLNAMHPNRDDIFVLGMIEATGLGWQGRHEQAELVARYIKGLETGNPAAIELQREKAAGFERLTGGTKYLDLARMAYYVDKNAFRGALKKRIAALSRRER